MANTIVNGIMALMTLIFALVLDYFILEYMDTFIDNLSLSPIAQGIAYIGIVITLIVITILAPILAAISTSTDAPTQA